jgi:RNA polymerase sigma-70 factor (ECF subfamily)
VSHGPDQNIRTSDPREHDPRAIVEGHWPGVYRLMYRLTANPHDAEELTQEAFLRALQKLDQYQAGTNMRGWLLRIATNMFLDGKRRVRPRTSDMEMDVPAVAERAGADLERMELSAQLQEALLKLPDTQRTVFLLRSTEDMAFREISEMIGTTEATARWHMLQARQQLLKLLEGKI